MSNPDRFYTCKVCGETGTDELCCPDPAAICPPQAPPPGVIYPPSHITQAQAVRIIKKSPAHVNALCVQGGPLQAEVWHGTKMIPMWRLALYLQKHPVKR